MNYLKGQLQLLSRAVWKCSPFFGEDRCTQRSVHVRFPRLGHAGQRHKCNMRWSLIPEDKGSNIWIFNESKEKNVWPNAIGQAFTAVSNPVGSLVSSESSGIWFPGPSPDLLCMGQPGKAALLVLERWKAETLLWKTPNTSRFRGIWRQKADENLHQCHTVASSWFAESRDLLQCSTWQFVS